MEYSAAWLRGTRSVPDGDTFRERIENLGKHKPFAPLLTPEEVARRILEEDTVIKDQEKDRIAWLRILSGAVGIVLAATMQVDSLQLLEPVLGDAANTFRPPHEAGQTVEWYTFETIIEQNREVGDLNPTLRLSGALGAIVAAFLGLTPGIVLSGLGAAAGSGFWHDQLGKLRSAKQVVTQGQKITGQVGGWDSLSLSCQHRHQRGQCPHDDQVGWRSASPGATSRLTSCNAGVSP